MMATAIGLTIAAPWFILVGIQTDWEFWRVFFWHHNFARATGSSAELASHPAWFYLVRWIVDWLPWSPLLLVAIIVALRQPDSETRLGLVWMLVVTAILSLARFKRADYLLPAYPGAAIVLGCVAERLYLASTSPVFCRRGALAGFAVVVAGYVAVELAYLPRVDAENEKRTAAASVRETKNPGAQLIFFRVEDHLLAWRLGKPLATVMEWENLDIWVSRLRPGWVMLPADELAAWPEHITTGTLHEVARFPDRTGRSRPRTWVLCRSEPHDFNAE